MITTQMISATVVDNVTLSGSLHTTIE